VRTRLELSIAWRYLRSRRGSRLFSFITFIAMGGVVVGVSALVVIMGVMNGLQTDLRDKIMMASPDLRVLNWGDDLQMPGWRETLAKVKRSPDVVAAAPFVLTSGVANVPGRSYTEGVQIVGIEPSGPALKDEVTPIRSKATQGDFTFATPDGKRRGAVLGSGVAAKLTAYPGTTISIFTAASVTMNQITGQLMPVPTEFVVTGVFDTGMYEYDSQYIFVDLAAAQAAAKLDTAVTGLEVRTKDRWRASETAAAIQDSLEYPYRTLDWQAQNSALFKALKLEKLGMGVILGLITLVAAFNIVGTLTMVVRDKQREIGILKAMGLTSASVRRVFLMQGAVIGVVGTSIGMGLGLVAAVALEKYRLISLDPSVYFIDHLPVRLQLADLAITAAASFLISGVATLYPAARAARLYPVEAIRSE
jgi:lipoprotein-releasing system permease protein